MNPMELFKLKGMFAEFQKNHPKFPMFVQAVMNQGIREDTILELKVVSPEGREMTTNLKVKQSDLELFEALKNLRQ